MGVDVASFDQSWTTGAGMPVNVPIPNSMVVSTVSEPVPIVKATAFPWVVLTEVLLPVLLSPSLKMTAACDAEARVRSNEAVRVKT
jgi:hypothetical protein